MASPRLLWWNIVGSKINEMMVDWEPQLDREENEKRQREGKKRKKRKERCLKKREREKGKKKEEEYFASWSLPRQTSRTLAWCYLLFQGPSNLDVAKCLSQPVPGSMYSSCLQRLDLQLVSKLSLPIQWIQTLCQLGSYTRFRPQQARTLPTQTHRCVLKMVHTEIQTEHVFILWWVKWK